ncbi:extracellular catalytic domain type 1 short-chain-length polyhydroxyalkanoate depolymerase [Hydrogenophaga pseudoflava]|uniref:extracellular catalytic domain type 1 short-chain-length polyhydroxyalkanoate depolymerase n=1 Tax=Hydrogenophaga pseudoflava TaxID=47421 RepID=UPI0027E3FE30|nr:PHB depolymerase family esterase [Hydrogenophaga pseudoflava]MDQ7745071.1 PHB depolymerase family esterase [Hydrogenophaga pseudoflava]
MKKRPRPTAWANSLERSFLNLARQATASGSRALATGLKPARAARTPPPGAGAWLPGVVMGAQGVRRFRLYRPPGILFGERLPLMVMLHGCGQDARSFALSTRMNRLALRERFLVLYPEQDRLANPQGCWNWYDTESGRAFGEAALIMQAVDQVCLLHPVDRARVAVAGLSAGASMAALLVTRSPERFKAVVMHSGIPPGTAHSTMSALGAMHGRRTTSPLAVTPEVMAAHWPPLLVIHGDADSVVSLRNGEAAVQVWAQAAGARAGQVRTVQRGQRYPMSVTDFKRKGRTVASLVAVSGLAHSWSGGAASQAYSDRRGPDASRMAWTFAARQFRSALNA